MRKTTTLLAIAIWLCQIVGAAQFQNIPFNQDIDTNSIETAGKVLSMTNDTAILGVSTDGMNNTSKVRAGDVNGVTVDIYEDGKLKIYFNDPLADANPLDKILVNDVPLLDEIDKRVFKQYNPLYGKKLAVVGDSLTVAPSVGKSYSSFIAQRNNMVLVNKGKSG